LQSEYSSGSANVDARWILFDAVGTLIHPAPPVAEVYHAAGRRFGSQLQQNEILARFGRALAREQNGGPTSEANERQRWQRIVRQVFDDVPLQADALFEALWHHFAQPPHWRLYEDVAGTLNALRGRGFKLGIASNFDSRLKNIVAGHSPLAACEAVFVSSEVGYTKPDLRFFRAIEELLEACAGQILLVGDDEIADVQGATKAGWQIVLLNRDGFGPRGAIRTLEELPVCLKSPQQK
jgi:putative hydrolase of the HAD superfamily